MTKLVLYTFLNFMYRKHVFAITDSANPSSLRDNNDDQEESIVSKTDCTCNNNNNRDENGHHN